MEPLLSLFAQRGRAIAWDTPGYGQSDPLPAPGVGLAPYVEALHRFIGILKLDRPVIYGSATGAQIAIEYGKAYPRHTRGLLLENVAWFYDDEREAMMEPYFPDLTPRADGSHFAETWHMVNQLYRYFPWYDTSPETLVNSAAVPVDVLHKTALDYLRAGPDYDLAYRAAFINERPEQLQPLRVPTRILRWRDSLLKKYSDRLDAAELPVSIEMRFADSGLEARFDGLDTALGELLGGASCRHTGTNYRKN
ncbi:alpha/beta hydrolase [Exilibacterium tricleocarpae]|uniref:Alpha/beta hydrolase n=2 Tax=Exilibacterium tricleocarpae TaxID=2591008 RepID=A0A545TVZ1_9GAMM|nr:alpha/beta hydrolase [Exilibacterium tricleocarpae]